MGNVFFVSNCFRHNNTNSTWTEQDTGRESTIYNKIYTLKSKYKQEYEHAINNIIEDPDHTVSF